ncbi:MAG: flagellar hook-length control protein FliK [Gammaproteobacteria bacterium]
MVTPTLPSGPAAVTLTTAVPARGDSALSTWRVGQVLAATVVSSPQPGRAELRIGNLQLAAQTGNLQLTAGQTLRLEVASLREMPVLKLLGVLQQSPVNQALRDALPRQQPLSPLLNALTRLAAAGQLPPEAARLARELLVRLPEPAAVATPAGLRQALRDSGLFLEAKLARPNTPPGAAPGANPPATGKGAEFAGDLKANLLRLVQALRDSAANSAPAGARSAGTAAPAATPGAAMTPPAAQLAAALAATGARGLGGLPGAPPLDPGAPLLRGQPPQPPATAARLAQLEQALGRSELLRQVEGALARVQLNQLSSLPQDRTQPPEWLIELPVRREGETDVWALRIGREPERDGGRDGGRDDEDGPAWTVMLAFDLPGLGPMQTRISLRGDSVDAQFFSREQGILPVVAEHLPVLQARLQQAGLRVNELSCRHGQIPAPAAPPQTRILDERA